MAATAQHTLQQGGLAGTRFPFEHDDLRIAVTGPRQTLLERPGLGIPSDQRDIGTRTSAGSAAIGPEVCTWPRCDASRRLR
jgi:hypothetical protein